MIPRLETQRLILREWRHSDLDAFAAIYAVPDVMRYLSGDPLTRQESWRNMATAAGHWVLRGYGTWVVERKEDGGVVGRVGLIQPEGWPGLEVGWTLGKPYWGKGYATEAISLISQFAFNTLNLNKLEAGCYANNIGSARAFEKCGYQREGLLRSHVISDQKEVDVILLGITAADFAKDAK